MKTAQLSSALGYDAGNRTQGLARGWPPLSHAPSSLASPVLHLYHSVVPPILTFIQCSCCSAFDSPLSSLLAPFLV